MFNLILPCALLTGVALLSFYMPSESGEKVTLGITTLLSMTVFLMVIGESMPPTSEKLPLIGKHYVYTHFYLYRLTSCPGKIPRVDNIHEGSVVESISTEKAKLRL